MQATRNLSKSQVLERLPTPVIILSPPRSGSTVFFEQLVKLDGYWSIGGESHAIFRAFPHLRAKNAALDSMALDVDHADPETCDLFRRCFLALLRNNRDVPYLSAPSHLREKKAYLLEKTPRNALNIPFLRAVFPDAHYIYLQRNFRQTISSLIEAWTLGLQSGHFVTFRDLPEWPLPAWCFLLPEDWRKLRGKSLAEIAAFQWQASHLAIIEGLADLPRNQWSFADYSDLIDNPVVLFNSINASLGLPAIPTDMFSSPFPLSRTTVTAPSSDKWKRHKKEINALLPSLLDTQSKIDAFLARK